MVLTTATPGVPVLRIQSQGVVLREVVVKWNAGSDGVEGAEHGGADPTLGVLPRLAQKAIAKVMRE